VQEQQETSKQLEKLQQGRDEIQELLEKGLKESQRVKEQQEQARIEKEEKETMKTYYS